MDIQRLRNLTTGRLHTKMDDIYKDLEYLSGEKGIMTHMLPRIMNAVEPWLRQQVTEPRFWEDKFDRSHVGEFEIKPMDAEAQRAMFARYGEMPNPLVGKEVIAVSV